MPSTRNAEMNMSPGNTSEPTKTNAQLLHDLRNAINAMVTSISCLNRCEDLPPEYQRFVQAAQSNGKKASTILAGLADRIGAATPDSGQP